MKVKKNWEVHAGILERARNLVRKGGLNPAFYLYRYRFNAAASRCRTGKYPIDVIAEASNACNLRCTMCFQVDSKLPVKNTTRVPFMTMETFRRIADECAVNKIPALKLNWRGEPMLNENFAAMVRYAKSKGIMEVTSLTNATLMTEDVCKEIVGAGMDQLVISVDGFTKETYEKIRVGAGFDEVMANIDHLIRIRGKARKPFIRLQYTESETNRHETRQFYEYWHGKVDEITISYRQDFGAPEIGKEDDDLPTYSYVCRQPFQRLVVMTDGTVCMCATDVMGYNSIGNVHEKSLFELWHCEKIEQIRSIHKKGRYFENAMCKICVHNINSANKTAGR